MSISKAAVVELRHAEDEGFQCLPLTPVQELFSMIELIKPGAGLGPTFTIHDSYRVDGPLDVDRLSAAFTDVVARHPALRTAIAEAETGGLVRRVSPPRACSVEVRSGSPETAEPVELARAHALEPVDVAKAPIVRMFASGQGHDHVVTVVAHHAVIDHWSIEEIVGQVLEEYGGDGGHHLPTPEIETEPAAFGDDVAMAMDYWREHLAGMTLLKFPPGTKADYAAARSAFVAFEFGSDTLANIETFVRLERATPFIAYIAAFKALAACLTGERDLIVPTLFSGRGVSADENEIGFALDPLVLRTRLTEDPTLVEVFRSVRCTILDAYDHRAASIVALLGEIPELAALLAAEDQPWTLFQQIDLPPVQERQVKETTWYPLAPRQPGPEWRASLPLDFEFTVMRRGTDAYGLVSYNTSVCDRSTVDGIVDDYLSVLGLIVEAPETRLSAVRTYLRGVGLS